MKLYYAGDVHGSEKCWRKFLNAAKFYEADTLIMGGDITGKMMVPVVATADGRHEARVLGRARDRLDRRGSTSMEKRIRFNGFYPYRCDRTEYDRLNSDTAYREETFTRLMVDEVRRWIALAEERLAGTGIRCFVMPGNDDEFAIDEALESTTVVNPDNRVVRVGDDVADALVLVDEPHAVGQPARGARGANCSSGFTGWPPSSTPSLTTIFNLHCPPHGTMLDRAPQLTADLKVVLDGGEPRIVSVGSTAVRTLIEEVQPVLSLHGHIHESKAIAKIGKTTCVNPGSAYSEGVIDGAVIDLRKDRVRSCQLVTG